MSQRFGEIGPLIHFDEQVGQVDQGQTRCHGMLKACDTFRPLFSLQGWHDDPSFLHAYFAYAAIASYEPIDTGKEFVQLSPPLIQTRRVRVFALKEGLRLTGAQDLQSRVMVTLFSLFAEIKRELLSLRTKEALATARAAGKRLGRPPGARGQSKHKSAEVCSCSEKFRKRQCPTGNSISRKRRV
jgi:hypothetical protein